VWQLHFWKLLESFFKSASCGNLRTSLASRFLPAESARTAAFDADREVARLTAGPDALSHVQSVRWRLWVTSRQWYLFAWDESPELVLRRLEGREYSGTVSKSYIDVTDKTRCTCAGRQVVAYVIPIVEE
jgi:hypothetical protein